MNNVQTKAAGDGEGTVHGMCQMCGNTRDVYPKYGYICAECLGDTEFMDEIVVTPGNDGWGGSNYCGLCGGNCDCLKNGSLICFCSPGDNPGTGCSYCGISGCNGECRNCGEGNGNGNNGTGSLNINWTSDQSFNSLFQSVLNVNNSFMNDIISNINSSQIEINMHFSDTLSMIAGAYITLANAFIGEDYTIEFHNNFNSLNPLTQKVIIIHELLHLKIYAMLKNRNVGNMGEVLPNFSQYYYNNEQSFNGASHEYFAANYLNQIEDIIEIIAPDLEADKAKWASLTETDAYENLPLVQREDIMNYLIENNL